MCHAVSIMPLVEECCIVSTFACLFKEPVYQFLPDMNINVAAGIREAEVRLGHVQDHVCKGRPRGVIVCLHQVIMVIGERTLLLFEDFVLIC